METYPGVDYLGLGYDAIHGNPDGSDELSIDDGFRQPVRKASYSGVTVTRDNRYLTPDGSYATPLSSCYRSETMSDITTESNYQRQVAHDAWFSLGVKAQARARTVRTHQRIRQHIRRLIRRLIRQLIRQLIIGPPFYDRGTISS